MKQLLVLFLALVAPTSVIAADLTAADQQRIAGAAADIIERRYVDPAKGRDIARALRDRDRRPVRDLSTPHH